MAHMLQIMTLDKRTTAQKAADLFRDECKFEILYWVHFLADTYEVQFGACKAMESQLRTFTGISPLVHVLLGKLEGMQELMQNYEVGLPGGLIKGGHLLQWFYKQWFDGTGLTFDIINIVYDVQPLEVRLVCFVVVFCRFMISVDALSCYFTAVKLYCSFVRPWLDAMQKRLRTFQVWRQASTSVLSWTLSLTLGMRCGSLRSSIFY